MKTFETLEFRVFANTTQRLTLLFLKTVTATVVVEAIVRQRNFYRKKFPSGALTDLGKFDKARFLTSYLDDKSGLFPISQTHPSILAGATMIADSIITEPGKDDNNKPKIPGQYQLNYRGGVNYAFNLILNNFQSSPSLNEVSVTEKVKDYFKPMFQAEFPHLGEIKIGILDEKRSIEEINQVFEYYRPIFALFKEKQDKNDHENYWILNVILIHKAHYTPMDIKVPGYQIVDEPLVVRPAYLERRRRETTAKNRDHTSCKTDPLSLK